jgi:hypothetical protein
MLDLGDGEIKICSSPSVILGDKEAQSLCKIGCLLVVAFGYVLNILNS